MKKNKIKVAFFITSLGMGGIEKSLLSLLKKLKENNKYDIDIYVLKKEGELCSELETMMNVYEIADYKNNILSNTKKMLMDTLKNKEVKRGIKIIIKKVDSKLKNRDENCEVLDMKCLEKKYDIAVSYQVPISPITIYVAEKVKARKKILWCHMDIASLSQKKLDIYIKYFDKYDKFFCVSKKGTDKFKKIMCKAMDKCIYFPNIILKDEIIKKAQCKVNFDDNYKGVKILTVARLAKGKGHELAIQATRQLINDGYDIKWYFIGNGENKSNIEKKISKYKLKNNVFLLGVKSNPYPYMKKCDIYVQPSKFEGYCITTTEAKILSKAIITTNTDGANEKFINKEDSLIIEYNLNELVDSIKKLINDSSLKSKIEKKSNLNYDEIENITEFEKILE